MDIITLYRMKQFVYLSTNNCTRARTNGPRCYSFFFLTNINRRCEISSLRDYNHAASNKHIVEIVFRVIRARAAADNKISRIYH